MSIESPERFNQRQEEIERPISWEGLGSEMRKIPAEAARTKSEKEEIAREVESITLSPSMIERCFQTIFGRPTGEYTKDIYEIYIAPLKSPIAKMVMKTILVHASHRPEALRSLGPDVAKKELVATANKIADEIDTKEQNNGKMAAEKILAFVTESFSRIAGVNKTLEDTTELLPPGGKKKDVNELIDSSLDKKLILGDRLFADPRKVIEELTDSFKEPPKGLSYFPGMPGFTNLLKKKGYDNFSLVKIEVDRSRAIPDEEAYEIYFGAINRGRYTIRRKGGLVERNILFTYPDTGQVFTLPTAGNETQDLVRQAKEWLKIFKRTIKEKLGI